MPNRNVLMVLTIALCVSMASGNAFTTIVEPAGGLGGPASTVDVAVAIVSPVAQEVPGLVPVQVRLTNLGDALAVVPRLDVNVPPDYADSSLSITVPVGIDKLVTLQPWIYGGSTEVFTAWITFAADTNHSNDTAVVVVNPGGIFGRAEMGPIAGMSLTLSPSPLAGNVLHIEYSLNQTGPANVTFFDISGRPAATRRFAADRAGELPMDLRLLSGGVYLVRLDDGSRTVSQKLVVQR